MKARTILNAKWFSISLIITACAAWLSSPNPVLAGPATIVSSAIWAHDHLYGTVATDTSFNSPPPQSTDIIYSFANSGLTGQRSVSEAAPGDRDYNGGRWNVMTVTFTPAGLAFFDMDNDKTVDFELTSAEDVQMAADMGLLTITSANFYFVCPLQQE